MQEPQVRGAEPRMQTPERSLPTFPEPRREEPREPIRMEPRAMDDLDPGGRPDAGRQDGNGRGNDMARDPGGPDIGDVFTGSEGGGSPRHH